MIEFAVNYFDLYLKGIAVGFALTVAAMAGAIIIGLIAAFGRISTNSILRFISSVYVAVFRGIPPLLMLYVVYFGVPAWAIQTGSPVLLGIFEPLNNRLIAATVAFAINGGAYSTEIIRASILAVPQEQMETARSIAMSYWLAMRRIILPQAMRAAFPPLGNEFITVLKGTSLAAVIGVTELMRSAQLAASATFQNMTAYTFAAVFYVCLVIILQGAIGVIERQLTPARRRRQ
jgi:His/Glu/Gln/Arg/opine family amino acid ABC transporter permease subunit